MQRFTSSSLTTKISFNRQNRIITSISAISSNLAEISFDDSQTIELTPEQNLQLAIFLTRLVSHREYPSPIQVGRLMSPEINFSLGQPMDFSVPAFLASVQVADSPATSLVRQFGALDVDQVKQDALQMITELPTPGFNRMIAPSPERIQPENARNAKRMLFDEEEPTTWTGFLEQLEDGHVGLQGFDVGPKEDSPLAPKTKKTALDKVIQSETGLLNSPIRFPITPRKIIKNRTPIICSHVSGGVSCQRITKGKYPYCSYHLKIISEKYKYQKDKKRSRMTESLEGTDPDAHPDYSSLIENSPKKNANSLVKPD